MDAIETLKELNWFEVFAGFVAIILAFQFLYKAFIEGIIQKFGIETKGMRKRREEHELLINTAKGLNELQNRHISDNDECVKHDKEIRDDLKKLTNLFIEKQIDDMRYEILDFASSLSSGRKYNKEQFDHILSIDEKYKKILEDNGLENGQVTVSVEYINEVYKEKLRNGF